MLRSGLASVLAVAAGAIVLGFHQSASAGLSIVSQEVDVNRADQEVFFTLDFNHAPDFKAVDSLGRHLDSFQYEIVPNTTAPMSTLPFTAVGAVIRGDEIGSGNVVPIRNGFANGSDPNPAAGGWGTIRGTVPFTLSGSTMNFAASFGELGATSGAFSYRVFSTDFGSTVSLVESVSVPLPPALPAAAVTAGSFLALGILRRRMTKA